MQQAAVVQRRMAAQLVAQHQTAAPAQTNQMRHRNMHLHRLPCFLNTCSGLVAVQCQLAARWRTAHPHKAPEAVVPTIHLHHPL